MWLVLLLNYCLPFFSSLIALWLYWYMILLWIIYLCSCRKYWVHITWVSTSSTMTRSAFVDLLVVSFCFMDCVYSPPVTMVMKPPVWLRMSLCSANAPSTYNCMFPDLYIGKSVVSHWFFVCIFSPLPASCSRQCQGLSLFCTLRILLSGCLDIPSLKDIVVVLKNSWTGLHRLWIVWLNFLQCQRGGVQQVWTIQPLCLLEYLQEFSNVVDHL